MDTLNEILTHKDLKYLAELVQAAKISKKSAELSEVKLFLLNFQKEFQKQGLDAAHIAYALVKE